MRFFVIFFVLHSTVYAGDSDPTITGQWVQVQTSCDLELSEETIQALPASGGLSRSYIQILNLNEDNSYISLGKRGAACGPEFRPQIVDLDGVEKKAYCGRDLETHGYYEVRDGELVFSGWAVQQDGGFYEAYGIDTKKLKYNLIESADVLVTEHEANQVFCGGSRLIEYWIRPAVL